MSIQDIIMLFELVMTGIWLGIVLSGGFKNK